MNSNLRSNQSGLVSFIVTISLVIILALITTSFALLTRREQRRALDRQLSTQAFYAAESGVNAAIDNIDDPQYDNPVTDCKGGNPLANNNDVGDGFKYTCVLVNKSPKSLEYSAVKTDESTIVLIDNPSADKLEISWQASDQTGPLNYSNSVDFAFPDKNAIGNSPTTWKAGILRATLMPVPRNPAADPITRTNLINQSGTFFLYPQAGGTNSVALGSNQNGQLVSGNCSDTNTPRFCKVNITGLNSSNNKYYLRLTSVYKNSNVSIKAYFNATNTELELPGVQAVIDSTGKASDILRRVQVRVPLGNSYYYPEFAIETKESICKELNVYRGIQKVEPSNNSNCPTL